MKYIITYKVMSNRVLTLFFVCLCIIAGSAMAASSNADPRCEGLVGAAFGLCNAATSMDCDDPQSAPKGCDRVADSFIQITGEVPPWTEPVCADNSECSITELCRTPIGSCGASGVCEELPTACVDAYIPVCGCDGITYGNECEARLYGVSVNYDGVCGT